MSVLGDFVRMEPDQLEEIRSTPEDAYDRLTFFDPACKLDLDRAWSRLAFVMDAAGFPLNPITAGRLFPDVDSAWGAELDSRSLNADQVATASAFLRHTPFEVLAPYVPAAYAAEGRINTDPGPEILAAVHDQLASRYRALVEFFDAAAREGQCTVFWAA